MGCSSGSCGSGGCSTGSCGPTQPENNYEKPHELSTIKRVIAVVSGKGGVGKSLVTSLLSVASQRKGYKTAIIDADITGPSIPKAFGVKEKISGDDKGMRPSLTKKGTQIVSLNLVTENETDPVIWRGPILAGVVKQFWNEVIWDDVDYMFFDMPPGTGDVPLTVYQSIPIDGIVVVSSPQELVGMIVEKAVKMASSMNVPILGLVENMSYLNCPDCGKEIKVFGESHIENIAAKHKLSNLARIPIDPKIAAACDAGAIEDIEGDWLNELFDNIDKKINNKLKI